MANPFTDGHLYKKNKETMVLFWVNYLKGLLKTFNADTSPNEVASAFVLGATIGLIPKGNLATLLLLLITWIFRVNLGVALATIAVFAIIGHFTDPLAEKLGYGLLAETPSLQGLWTTLYNTPIIPYTGFNNTLVMGNLILALLLAVPLFLGMRAFIGVYRTRYRERVKNSRLMKALEATKFYEAYKRWIDRP
jgi:uncharacterized protein (TIGR03546 family)